MRLSRRGGFRGGLKFGGNSQDFESVLDFDA